MLSPFIFRPALEDCPALAGKSHIGIINLSDPFAMWVAPSAWHFNHTCGGSASCFYRVNEGAVLVNSCRWPASQEKPAHILFWHSCLSFLGFFFFHVCSFLNLFFNWCIIPLQHCVNFFYTCIPSFLNLHGWVLIFVLNKL